MSAKDLIVKPIASNDARAFIKKHHYSGKVVANSNLHFGVFWNDRLEGVMQYGSSMRKDLIRTLVDGTGWNEFLELNRMAFSDVLPRNSESRALAVSLKLIKKNYKHIKWIITFADGCQCGDGTIYRASGFLLTSIKENKQLRVNPASGEVMQSMAAFHQCLSKDFKNWPKLSGNQFRYIYFIDKTARERLTVPEIPFSRIQEMGAGMYKGIKRGSIDLNQVPLDDDGASPISTLQTKVA